MEKNLSEAYFDACLKARKIFQLLPPLPNDLQGRQIFILKTCHHLGQEKKNVQISDIAHLMDATLPSIAKSVADLENKGYLTKTSNEADKRKVNLQLTPAGEQIYQTYVRDFHDEQAKILNQIPQEELELTIRTMEHVYELLKENAQKNKKEEFDVS